MVDTVSMVGVTLPATPSFRSQKSIGFSMLNRRATETSALRSSMCSEWGTPSTRALHLLLKMSTGHSDVQLNRFIHRNKLRRGPRWGR